MLDADSADWLARLRGATSVRDAASRDLHALLLRAARNELSRRTSRSGLSGLEADDLVHQAADDAMLSVLRRLETFRGESRFTTWAHKFAIVEVTSKLGRHFGRRSAARLSAEQWEQLPERSGVTPDDAVEAAELADAVRHAVEETLTERQRDVFVSHVVDDVPLEALAFRMRSDRNSIYKVMFDARRKIRAALVDDGLLLTVRETDPRRG